MPLHRRRRIVLSHSGEATVATEALRQLATMPKVPDPLCVRLNHKVMCWLGPRTSCQMYFADEHIDVRAAQLLAVYDDWPHGATQAEWWSLADLARRALPLPGAAELVVSAFEASLQADSRCMNARAQAVHIAVDELRADPANKPLEPRMAKLADACPVLALDRAPQPQATWPAKPPARP